MEEQKNNYMRLYLSVVIFLGICLNLYSSIDTVTLSFFRYNKSLVINKSCKISISYIDSFGNKTIIKPQIKNGYIYINDVNFIEKCSIKFIYGYHKLFFDSAILVLDKKVNWQFGIDSTLDEEFKKYPEFMVRLPPKHKYYYLKMEPTYNGLGYTEYRFLNYKKHRK